MGIKQQPHDTSPEPPGGKSGETTHTPGETRTLESPEQTAMRRQVKEMSDINTAKQTTAAPEGISHLQATTETLIQIKKVGTLAELHKQWINDEPYRSTEIRKEIERWKKHFQRAKGCPLAFDDLDEEGMERSMWWHMFLVEIGEIDPDEILYD